MRNLFSSTPRKVIAGAVVVLAAGGAFMAIGPAAATGSTHTSSISLRYVSSHSAFEGQVTSRKRECISGRNVTVYKNVITYKAGHNKKHRVPKLELVAVGSNHTDNHGFYSVSYPAIVGTYSASVEKVSLTGYKHTVCKAATSNITVIVKSREHHPAKKTHR